MNNLAFCITTSDEYHLNWLKVSLGSLLFNNNINVLVFFTDNPDLDKLNLNFKNTKLINFDNSKSIKYKQENYNNFNPKSRDFVDLEIIMAFPDILDYIKSNYDFDVLFKFDTDTLFISEIDFETFYNSDKLYAGCYDLAQKVWLRTFNSTVRSIYNDTPVNSGLVMFKKESLSLVSFETVADIFKDNNYNVVCFEQDALNKIFENSKLDLNYQFYLNSNKPISYENSKFSAIHFCARDINDFSIKRLDPFKTQFNDFSKSQDDKLLYKNTKDFLELYRAYAKYFNVDTNIPEYFDSKFPVFNKTKLPKTAFYSTIIGNLDLYIDMAMVTMQSYIKTNTYKIDWLIQCENDEEIQYCKERLSVLDSDIITIKYHIMPSCKTNNRPEVDYAEYSPFNWTSPKGAEIFCRRIAYVDDIIDSYDIIVCVDFDIIFSKDISDRFINMFNSPYIVGGQTELSPLWHRYDKYKTMYNLCDHTTNKYYDLLVKHYFNFGFGIINCKNLKHKIPNQWEHFKTITKGYENYFCVQEQSYFSIISQGLCKHYDDLQNLLWNHLYGTLTNMYTKFRNNPLTHFTHSVLITKELKDIDDSMLKDTTNILVMLNYEMYLKCTLESKASENFKNKIKNNSVIIKKYINKNAMQIIRLKSDLKL